jgi:hypothetical protein
VSTEQGRGDAKVHQEAGQTEHVKIILPLLFKGRTAPLFESSSLGYRTTWVSYDLEFVVSRVYKSLHSTVRVCCCQLVAICKHIADQKHSPSSSEVDSDGCATGPALQYFRAYQNMQRPNLLPADVSPPERRRAAIRSSVITWRWILPSPIHQPQKMPHLQSP